jgi:hypothetical protein
MALDASGEYIPKTFRSNIPNSRYVFEDGSEDLFYNGALVCKTQKQEDEIRRIIGKNSNVYDPEDPKLLKEQKIDASVNAASEQQIAQEQALIAKRNTLVTGDANVPGGGDPAIAAALANAGAASDAQIPSTSPVPPNPTAPVPPAVAAAIARNQVSATSSS